MKEDSMKNARALKQIVLNAHIKDLQTMYEQQFITPSMVVEIYRNHIKQSNETINAVVEHRFAEAVKEVEQLLETNENDARRLVGIPFLIKEMFDMKGMKTTGGLLHRAQHVATEDAAIVKKLKDEGAIILGKTNTPELSFCQETENKLYGRTNNPRDLAKTAGGSSGGEAAAIAIGAAAAGIASDIGGSIRFPAHFNGVIGFKSGMHQVDSTGAFPATTDPLQERMLGIGPITKSVRDARFVYQLIAEEKMPATYLKDFTINILPKTEYPLSKWTAILLKEVYKRLRNDFLVERKIPPYFHQSTMMWQEIMSINGGEMAKQHLYEPTTAFLYKDFLKEKMMKKGQHHAYLTWALIAANLFKPSKRQLRSLTKKITKGDALLNDYLAKRILIFPVYHSPAQPHGAVYNELFSIRKTFRKYMPYIAYANVWGLPALTIPIGKNRKGMPIAIQLMSKNGNEDALFQLGAIIEREFLGYERAELQ